MKKLEQLNKLLTEVELRLRELMEERHKLQIEIAKQEQQNGVKSIAYQQEFCSLDILEVK